MKPPQLEQGEKIYSETIITREGATSANVSIPFCPYKMHINGHAEPYFIKDGIPHFELRLEKGDHVAVIIRGR